LGAWNGTTISPRPRFGITTLTGVPPIRNPCAVSSLDHDLRRRERKAFGGDSDDAASLRSSRSGSAEDGRDSDRDDEPIPG
jgi:hypothetical protein